MGAAAKPDMNRTIASLLRDLASVQKSVQSKWGYKRAASAVLNLEDPIEMLVGPEGLLRKIPNVGPASSRIILEVLETGTSPTVEQAIDASGRRKDIETSRTLRANYLSRAQVVATLRNRRLKGPTLTEYRGDCKCIQSGVMDRNRCQRSSKDVWRAVTLTAPSRIIPTGCRSRAACRWQIFRDNIWKSTH